MKLRKFWLLVFGTALAFLSLFGIFELTGASEWLVQPDPSERVLYALAGFALLLLDVVLPVPSSVIMLGNGALFGTAAGAALSVLGATGATLLGYCLGRASARPFAIWLGPDEIARARTILGRWGPAAIAATRPVPILAETVALVAGASGMGAARTVAAGALGSLPAAALYAWAGARGLDSTSDAAIFAVVLGFSATLWALGARKRR